MQWNNWFYYEASTLSMIHAYHLYCLHIWKSNPFTFQANFKKRHGIQWAKKNRHPSCVFLVVVFSNPFVLYTGTFDLCCVDHWHKSKCLFKESYACQIFFRENINCTAVDLHLYLWHNCEDQILRRRKLFSFSTITVIVWYIFKWKCVIEVKFVKNLPK